MSIKSKAVVVGAKVGLRLFKRAMDHFAEKRPNGLVARFRRTFGIVSEKDEASKLLIELAKKARRKS